MRDGKLLLWNTCGLVAKYSFLRNTGVTDVHCSDCFSVSDAVLFHEMSKPMKFPKEKPSPHSSSTRKSTRFMKPVNHGICE